MSYFKKLLPVMIVILLASCGLRPMYGDYGISPEGANARPDVTIGNIPDRNGQILRNLLIDRLNLNGRPSSTEYELVFEPIKITTTSMGIKKDATATRVLVEVSVVAKLIQTVNGEKIEVSKMTPHSVGAHNILDNQISSITSRADITEDLLKEITDEIVTEVDLYFMEHHKTDSKK